MPDSRLRPVFEFAPSATRGIIALVFLGLLVTRGWGAINDQILNPKTYTSPDGRSVLHVNPGRPDGGGAAQYRMLRDSREAWSGERDFTLWDAEVTDGGMVAGYSYQSGYEGRTAHDDDSDNALHAIILGPDGKLMLKDSRQRRHPGILSNPPSPYEPLANGLIVDSASDVLILRLSGGWGDRLESWARYTLSTGQKFPEFKPEQPTHGKYGFHRAHFCHIVPGTPLVLMQWYVYDTPEGAGPKGVQHSARQALLTNEGKQLWQFDVPREYNGLKERWSDYWDLTQPGIVQSGVGDKSFWFHSYSLKAKVYFAVSADAAAPGGWSVAETRREPADAPTPASKETPITKVDRAPLGVLRLQDAPGASQGSPLAEIGSFAMNERGTLAVVAHGPPLRLIVLDQTGAISVQQSLAGLENPGARYVTGLTENRWLISSSGIGDHAAAAWVFDTVRPELGLAKLDAARVGALREVTGRPDGGFVAITGDDWPRAHMLTAFGPTGQVQWTNEVGMVQGVAVASDGSVAVLQGIRNLIEIYSANGEPQRTIALEETLGHELNYVAGLAPAPNGGFVLFDFDGDPSVYVLDRDGKPLRSLTPAYEDGGRFRVVGTVLSALADGTLWAAAADGIMRLGDQGRATLTFGNAATKGDRPLRQINALSVTAEGKILAVNGEDGAVHVFDREGRSQRVLHPAPDDFVVQQGGGNITSLADGSIFYYANSQARDDGAFVHFAPDGSRVGQVQRVLGEVSEEWVAIPRSQSRWAVGYETLALVDEKHTIVKRIDRRPDQSWLGKLSDAAVAPDGSLAVISGPAGWGTRGPAYACVYSKTGEPRATIPLPEDTTMWRLAFNGRTIAATVSTKVYLIPVDAGRPITSFDLPAAEKQEAWWYLHCDPSGKELWARRSGTTELVRFPFE